MNEALPSPQDWETLADTGGRLAGSLDAACFDRRLAEALAMDRAQGRVDYALDFRRLPNTAVAVTGGVHAELIALCQRCLEPFELVLDLAPRLAFPSADSTSAAGEGWEPAEDGLPTSLTALIEEELLLGLPFAPRHSPAACRAAVSTPGPTGDVQRPFAELAGILKKRRSHND